MSVPSRKRWTLSVPRTRLSVSVGRSVSSPSAMLRALRKSKKRKPLIMTFGGAEVGLEDQSIRRIQSTILFSLRDWLLGGLIRPGWVFSYKQFGMGFGNRENAMHLFFSLFLCDEGEKRMEKQKISLSQNNEWHGALCDTKLCGIFFSFLLIYCIFFSPILNSSLRNAHLPANQQESPDD